VEQKLGALKPSSVVDQAFEYLRRMILERRLSQGERLVETDLAVLLGVSRATVREALRHLEVDGLVQTQPRRGTYVSRLSKKDAEEICVARALIEGYAVRSTISQITDEELAQLEASTQAIQTAADQGDIFAITQLDAQFHTLLCARSNNRRLMVLHSQLDLQIGALIMTTIDEQLLSIEQTANHHKELLTALRTRDPQTAERAVREHYLGIRHLDMV
jgi:DNA-binding GntR family transcriptional regulator